MPNLPDLIRMTSQPFNTEFGDSPAYLSLLQQACTSINSNIGEGSGWRPSQQTLDTLLTEIKSLEASIPDIKKETESSKIIVHRDNKENNLEAYYLSPDSTDHYALDFAYWHDIIAMQIIILSSIKPLQAIAAILYEMSWNGKTYKEHLDNTDKMINQLTDTANLSNH